MSTIYNRITQGLNEAIEYEKGNTNARKEKCTVDITQKAPETSSSQSDASK